MLKKGIAVINDFSGGQDTKTPIISMGLKKSPNMRNYHCAGVPNRLIKRGGFSKINSSAVESDGLDVYYSCGYQTTNYALRDAAARTRLSQGFKPTTTGDIANVKLWLKKVGTPAGGTTKVGLQIHTDSNGVPSGTLVAGSGGVEVAASDLATTYGWITFTWSSSIPSLVVGTQYHLVLYGTFTVSSSNYVHWGVDNYDVVYPDGTMGIYDGTTPEADHWVAETLYDACFEVYIEDGPAGDNGIAMWDFSSKNMLLGIFGASLYKMDKNSLGTPDGVWDAISGGAAWGSHTKLMLHCDGSDTGTTFTDEIGKTMTAEETAQLDTAQKKFGTASGLFDGGSDYLTTPDHDDWNFGTGDFTIDFWVRFNSLTGTQAFVSQTQAVADNSNVWSVWKDASHKLYLSFIVGGVAKAQYNTTSAVISATDTWYHIAFVRNTTVAKIFVDGVSKTLTETTAFGANDVGDLTGLLNIGRSDEETPTSYMNGWLDEIRISKGIANWIANFTPPASAYSAEAYSASSSRYSSFADWQSGRALINTDSGLHTYTGTGDASAVGGSPPKAKFMIIWKNYVFLAGVRGSPNQVRYSDLSTYATWTATNTLSFQTNDGDVITGIRILKGKLYIFKRYSIHRVTHLGSNPTFQVDQILGIGCPSHYTIKEVDLGGEIGAVLIFLTTDKELAVFDGIDIQIINDTLTEKTNDLFASTDDQPISFSDMNFTYIDLFHAQVKTDTSEYILYCVLSTDTTVNYAFVLDYKTGGVYPYDGQIFSSSIYAISTNKVKKLYCAGYTGYMWEMESGNDDDGSDINAYWVSGKVRPELVSLMSKALLLGLHFKEVTSGGTLSFQYRLDWNTTWTTAETTSFSRSDAYAFGKTALFDIGTIENMFQIKLKDNSSNPASTIYGADLFGEVLGVSGGDRATA